MRTGATPPKHVATRIMGRSWILRSKPRVRLFAAAVGVLVTLISTAAEQFFYASGQSPMMMMFASDMLAGLLSALVIVSLLERIVDRAEALAARLETIAEMNHHVRNALQVIAYSAHSIQDQQAIAGINDAAERIDWALRQILGSLASDMPVNQKPDAGR